MKIINFVVSPKSRRRRERGKWIDSHNSPMENVIFFCLWMKRKSSTLKETQIEMPITNFQCRLSSLAKQKSYSTHIIWSEEIEFSLFSTVEEFYYYTTNKNNQPYKECIFTSTRLKEKRFPFEANLKLALRRSPNR